MIESITEENIIDTTKAESIEKYKNNLSYLIKEAKEKGQINKFALIRNDDFFPYNSEWIINSENTNGEYRILARYVKNNQIDKKKRGLFNNLFRKKEEAKDLNELQFETLYLYFPVEFRTTKHFTVNTALGTTGEYNLVKADRKFTIIDGIDNFVNSGYGYSLSERDAYLDVSHESLKISDDAIVLISMDTYNEIKANKELMKEISKKKLIIYKGDLDTAINMILTENKILPTRTEYNYDSELKDIISKSFRNLCNKYNLEYNRPHGMSGHFTSYIDQYNPTSESLIKEFIKFVNHKLGEKIIPSSGLVKNINWCLYSEKIGIDKMKIIIDEFNSIKQEEIKNNRIQYIEDRKKITPEISELFRETIALIRNHEDDISFISVDSELSKNIFNFYIAPTVSEQVNYANEIKNYFMNYSNRK